MAASLTVAAVGTPGIAAQLGKKGTLSDLSLFNDAHEQRSVTYVEPTQFPDKLSPLWVALGMADHVLLSVLELNRGVAETIAAVELTPLPVTVVRGPGVGEAELSRVLQGSRLAAAPQLPLDPPTLRGAVEGWEAPLRAGPLEVPIDHAFPVKGVGAVALGFVRCGTLRVHERLRLWPTPKVVEVRSLQVHDIDRKEATQGERVGVAVKGVDADELERGQVLAPEGHGIAESSIVGTRLEKCRYYRGDVRVGAQIHVALGLQVVPASVDEIGEARVRLTADRPVAQFGRGRAYLLDLSVPAGPRIIGATNVGGTSA